MNLLNADDLTNALSQQCWQEDQSHLLLPLCQHRCSGSVCAGCSRTNACDSTSGGCTGWEGWSGTLRWQLQFNMFVRLWCETLVWSSHIGLVRAKPFSHRVFYLSRDWKAIIVLTPLVDMSIQNPPCIYFNGKQTCHRNVMVVAI